MQQNRRGFFRQCGVGGAAAFLASGSPDAEDTSVKQATAHPRLNPWRLEPIDLTRFIHLGVDHIYRGALNPRRAYLPYVRFNLTDPPTWARHEYWGSPHMVGRFLDALALADEVADVEHDEQAVAGLRKLAHECLDNSYGLPFDTLPDPQGKRGGNMHHCREVLLALVALHRWRGCERSAELARALVRAMEQATRETSAYPSHVLGEDGWGEPEPGWINYTTGRAIGALIVYYRDSNDGLALELAKRFADANIGTTFTPDGELTPAAGYHLRSTGGTMTALLDLGVEAAEAKYFEFGRKLYDGGLKIWRTSYGWAKENSNLRPGRGEANNTGDFIDAALTLARNGHPEYFADAERFIRNGLLAAQIVATDWIAQSEKADTDDYAYSNMRERARGAFAFTTPNGYHSYNTDLMGGAIRALCNAQESIVSKNADGARVNMLFNVDGEYLDVRSMLPEEGRVDLSVKRPCVTRVRLPEGVAREDIALRVDGEARAVEGDGLEIDLGALAADTKVALAFKMSRRSTEEAAPGWPPHTIEWVGNTIGAMSPSEGPIALY